MFFGELVKRGQDKGIHLRTIPCGSRNSTYEDFAKAIEDHRDAFVALLVDSEGPVSQTPWNHLNWDSCGKNDDHCHLMVQAMEAWFIADADKLKEYYRRGFNENHIPKDRDIERIEKSRLDSAMKEATRNTSKKTYDKTRDAPKLLAIISAAKVREASQHCNRLFNILTAQIDAHL
ncbi:MAG: DUF4276 family protein [Acidobacteria bacterium]|nr:DUF4276 family protein [Acidobacteriota bacterium]